MKVGIVIAVADYAESGLPDLPGCQTDGEAIDILLRENPRFDDLLLLNSSTSSVSVKRRLTDYIKQHSDGSVDEVFFYFSGHGQFDGSEFHYLLSDFDEAKKSQTSLQNSELDKLLRGLRAPLVVKVVDACQSGVPYIKDVDGLSGFLEGTQDSFENCYFMYSSRSDQSSYQNEQLSFFTREFAKSLIEYSGDTIRYKDIIDSISDAFTPESSQTPFFVTQATFTEVFCEISDSLRDQVSSLLARQKEDKQSGVPERPAQIVEVVALDAENYCSEEEAMDILDKIRAKVVESALFDELTELYQKETISDGDYTLVPSLREVGKWLAENKHDLFGEATTEPRRVRKPKDPLRPTFFTRLDEEKDYVWQTVPYVTGAKPTCEMPYSVLLDRFIASYPNIPDTALAIVPFLSRRELRLFYASLSYTSKGWKGKSLEKGRARWRTRSFPLRNIDVILDSVSEIWYSHCQYTLETVRKRFGLADDEDESAGEKDEKS